MEQTPNDKNSEIPEPKGILTLVIIAFILGMAGLMLMMPAKDTASAPPPAAIQAEK